MSGKSPLDVFLAASCLSVPLPGPPSGFNVYFNHHPPCAHAPRDLVNKKMDSHGTVARETWRRLVPGEGGAQKKSVFSCICVLFVTMGLFSLGHSVWVACGAELWPRKVCVCAGSSFALRSCTACPCSYVFMWHSGRSRDN